MTEEANSGPLAGLRVIELANVIAGPTTGQILGDFGADVIKVEHPENGDGSRRQGRPKDGVPLWWKSLGRNKRSIAMYLGDPEAAEVFLKLAATADVVVENFRPGTLERWNLGYDRLAEVNPRIILARLTGFGQKGPYSHKPAFGTVIEAMSGIADLTGEPDGPPMLPVFALGDYITGFSMVAAIMMALYHRDAKGGEGQVIDAALLRPLIATLGRQVVHWDQLKFQETRSGNRSPTSAPRNAYRTKDDKWVCLSAATVQIAARVMRLVGAEEVARQPWFATAAGRVAHFDEVDGPVAAWVAARTRDEVMRASEEAETTFGPIYSIPEMMADEHILASDIIPEVDDPDLGKMRMTGMLFELSKTPGRIRWTGPKLASSTDAILIDELGIPAETIARLRERRVVL
jgi:crotonobetainyl-CoA:carnitine CoA-transferase CaiB-like acyl-CoA transferase